MAFPARSLILTAVCASCLFLSVPGRCGASDSSGGGGGTGRGSDSSGGGGGTGRGSDSSGGGGGSGRGRDSSEGPGTSFSRDPTSDGADSSGQSYGHDCDGLGTAYCSRPAVTETECPPLCAECGDRDGRTDLTSRAKSKLYDYVYLYRGKMCLSHCSGRTKCRDWDVYKDQRHCKSVYCRDSSEGILGCQSYGEFSRPSCRDCQLVFPRACFGRPLSSDENSNEWDESSDWPGHRVFFLNWTDPSAGRSDAGGAEDYGSDGDAPEVFFDLTSDDGWNVTSLSPGSGENTTVAYRVVDP